MNEVGTSLTVTAVIATLVSVIFAIAAFYVSHRRQKDSPSSPSTPMQTTARVFGEHTKSTPRPHIPMASAQSDTSSKPVARTPEAPSPSSSPRFKQLGTHGVENPLSDTRNENQYVWE